MVTSSHADVITDLIVPAHALRVRLHREQLLLAVPLVEQLHHLVEPQRKAVERAVEPRGKAVERAGCRRLVQLDDERDAAPQQRRRDAPAAAPFWLQLHRARLVQKIPCVRHYLGQVDGAGVVNVEDHELHPL